jgi:hypothetical protein
VGTCIDAEQTSPFETGRAAERLFWRHSSARGVGSVLAHPLEIAVDFFSQTPRTGAISKLLGRMAALPEAARLIRHARRFGEATSPPAMPSSPRTSRIRFDGSHAQRRTSAANAETAVR